MTTQSLSTSTVLEIIDSKSNDDGWTSRTVLEELKLPKDKKNRNSCRRILHSLWIAGSIQRKASVQKHHSVAYCNKSVALTDVTVPCAVCAFPLNKNEDVTQECLRCAEWPAKKP